uniref:Uncharacterized protein n=1 Tax=Moniliophthora roreri TaxID=221103 RepID=A0A0W0FBA7_MONRR
MVFLSSKTTKMTHKQPSQTQSSQLRHNSASPPWQSSLQQPLCKHNYDKPCAQPNSNHSNQENEPPHGCQSSSPHNPQEPQETPEGKKACLEWLKWAAEAKAEHNGKVKSRKVANKEVKVVNRLERKSHSVTNNVTRYNKLEVFCVAGAAYMRLVSMEYNLIPVLFQIGLEADDTLKNLNSPPNIIDSANAPAPEKDDENEEDDTPYNNMHAYKTYLKCYENLIDHSPEIHNHLMNCVLYNEEELYNIFIVIFRNGYRQAHKVDGSNMKQCVPSYLLNNPEIPWDDSYAKPALDPSSKHNHRPKHPLIGPQLATGSYIFKLTDTKSEDKRKKIQKAMAKEFKKTLPKPDTMCWHGIFIGHSAAHTKMSALNWPCIAKIGRMTAVTPASIAYIYVQIHHALSTHKKWRQVQGKFDYFALYCFVLHIFEMEALSFVKKVLDEWNKQCFMESDTPMDEGPSEDSSFAKCIAAAAAAYTSNDDNDNTEQPQQPPSGSTDKEMTNGDQAQPETEAEPAPGVNDDDDEGLMDVEH